MAGPVIYTMAIIKDGKVIATKSVKTYLEGAVKAVTPENGEIKAIEYAWMMRGKELARDILLQEGRWPAKVG